ncbi:MAG TPA: O-antigen ligase family protein [Nitrospira sp.]|jgi:probable O-glycosylation ligase (exosortase A-associated)|nr:O-antigen ligase family protein [Nitrospira sp.]
MAQELELEWWRPGGVTHEASVAEAPPDTAQAWLPFWSVMAFTAVLLFSPQTYLPALAPLRPALLIIAIGVLSYVSDRWSRRLPIVEWNREMGLIAALAGLALFTVPFSLWQGGSVAVLADYAKTIAIFVLLSHVVTSLARLRLAAWLLTCMAIGLGFFAVYNFMTGAMIDQGVNQDRVVGNEGALTKNPNDLALMVNLLLPLTVGLFLASTEVWQRAVLFAAIGVEAGTVVLTYSRGGAITLAVIVLAYLWKLRGRRERSWIYAGLFAAVLALPLLPSSYFDRMSTITNVQADRTGSAQERIADMIIAAKTILDNPVIGAGMGMNMIAMREARGGWLPVHNVYLELALDLGVFGLALFLVLMWSCIQAVARIQQNSVPPDLYFLAQGLEISLIAYATAAMFHPVSYQYYFYYIAGLAICARTIAGTIPGRALEVAA